MLKISRLLKKKTAYIIIGIGLACLVLGPFFGIILDKMTIYERKPEVIQEDSDTYIRDAFAYPVTLSKDQKLIIEISEFYPNSSVTIRIVAKSAYDLAYSLNSNPGGIPREEFVYSEFGWVDEPADSTTGDNSLDLPDDGFYFYIEFMGGRAGYSLISWPGDYYVIVYGSNSGPPSDTNVTFDITIKVDGPGETLNNFLIFIGAAIIIVYVMLALISVLKANYLR
ncbi:MAG: hypothetical protein HWN80_05960 [Candidatus Lokiarchaeota archaeon]|nr:hypothetical protein [Candidatus Lokiarchaeota archaeon]